MEIPGHLSAEIYNLGNKSGSFLRCVRPPAHFLNNFESRISERANFCWK